MYQPISFGYYYGGIDVKSYPNVGPINSAFAIPVGRGRELKTKSSWMKQGRAVANGHEVAHCKRTGKLGSLEALPTMALRRGTLTTYVVSGIFYAADAGITQPIRYFFNNDMGLKVQVTVDNSRVWCNFQVYFDGIIRSSSSAGFRVLAGTFEVTKKQPGGVWKGSPDVRSTERARLLRTFAAIVNSYRPESWRKSDWSWNSTSEMTERLAEVVSSSLEWATGRGYLSLQKDFMVHPSVPCFALDEPETLLGGAPIAQPFGAYHLNALKQAAYLDCLDHVPKLNDNMIANILDIVKVVFGFVTTQKIELPKNLAESWLQYRYVYGTAKMDAEDALRYLKQASTDLSKGFSCYGQATDSIMPDVVATVKCSAHFRQRELDQLSKFCSVLYKYGLSPNAYVIWDLIPYSFVIDWFLPIGDILHGYDVDQIYNRTFDISDLWYSLAYDRLSGQADVMHCYTRWAESDTPNLNGFYTIETNSTSGKTAAMRVLDALSLSYRR